MVLGEAYLKDILRTPPTTSLPENVPHPYQKSFYTYASKKLIPKHWFLLAGFATTLTLYGILDDLRDSGKKSAYDTAVLAGKAPCKQRACWRSDLMPGAFVPASHTGLVAFMRERCASCTCLQQSVASQITRRACTLQHVHHASHARSRAWPVSVWGGGQFVRTAPSVRLCMHAVAAGGH